MRWLFFLISLLLLGGPALARDRGVGVYFDQDLFVPALNEDRDYTMGVAVEFFEDDGPLYLLDDYVQVVGRFTGLQPASSRVHKSYVLGSVNYTPDDLSASDPIFDERPYASLVYLANKRVVADGRRAIGVELLVGLLGTNVAREVQRKLHGWWRDASGDLEPVDPEGWAHQISAGGEPTLRLRVADSHLLAHSAGRRWWDLSGTWDLSLGYQTNASSGLSLRLGDLGSDFWSIPFDPINRGNFVPSLSQDETYFWLAARGRAVAYDALLQGQFRDSSVTLGGDDLRRILWEAAFGLTKSWRGMQFTLALNAKSAETRLASDPSEHYWGGLYFNYAFD